MENLEWIITNITGGDSPAFEPGSSGELRSHWGCNTVWADPNPRRTGTHRWLTFWPLCIPFPAGFRTWPEAWAIRGGHSLGAVGLDSAREALPVKSASAATTVR